MSAAEELAEKLSLMVREKRLRRGGFSEEEIQAPPLPLSAHSEEDQRNWLDHAEAVLELYGLPPDGPTRRELAESLLGIYTAADHSDTALWSAVQRTRVERFSEATLREVT